MEKILYKTETFEGPLDLLLHLIKKHKLNIHDIKISELLEQYMEQINLMKEQNLDINSEFLEMAARLIYIKTVSLLPKNEEAKDLKEELTEQLLEYNEIKEIAKVMSSKINLDFISREPLKIDIDLTYKLTHKILELKNSYIISSYKKFKNKDVKKEDFSYIVSRKIVSVFSKTIHILKRIIKGNMDFKSILKENKNKSELIATFLATLELVKNKTIVLDEKNLKIKIKEDKNWKLKKQKQQ